MKISAKRILSLLLCFILAAGFVAMGAVTASAEEADPYSWQNPNWGQSEGNIVRYITYMPDSDGGALAQIHIDLSCVDPQRLTYDYQGFGYSCYSTDGKLHNVTVGVDPSEPTFDIEISGLEYGKSWRFRAHLAYDYYADEEWTDVEFFWLELTVPERQITVGGVTMKSGQYLGSNSSTPQNSAPTSGGYAYYNNGTLTLHDFNRPAALAGGEYVIESVPSLNIVLEGTNTLATEGGYCIFVVGELHISGTGRLSANATQAGLFAFGNLTAKDVSLSVISSGSYGVVSLNETIALENCSLTVSSNAVNLLAHDDVTVINSTVSINGGILGIGSTANVTADGSSVTFTDTQEAGIAASNNITVSNSTVTVNNGALYGLVTGNGSITINDSTVTITDPLDAGISAENCLTIRNSTVTVKDGEDDGLVARGDIVINDSTLDLTGYYGIYTWANLMITDSDVVVKADTYALVGEKNISLRNSDVLAVSEGTEQQTMFVEDPANLIYDSSLIITASSNTDGSNPVAFNPANLADYCYLKFETPKTGWVRKDDNWYFYENQAAVTGWKTIEGKRYYFREDGVMQTGWLKLDGKEYCFENNGALRTGWYKEAGVWRYLKPGSGEMAVGWQQISGKWYYFKENGRMVTGSVEIEGKRYEFNSDGTLKENSKNGWVQDGGKWYYYEGGAMVTGWKQIGGKWYYLDAAGVMKTGWLKLDGKWYFLEGSGAMKTGWLQQGSSWYYLNSSGVMVTGTVTIDGKQHRFTSAGIWQGEVGQDGWVKENGLWYYYKNGAKATGWQKIDGTYYYFKTSGVMATGWLKEGSTYYYLQSSGAMATGWVNVSGKYYYFNTSGAMQTGWVKVGSSWYYMDASGAMVTGWLKLDGKWYYFSSSGAMVTGTVTIDGKSYKFNSSGVWIG